MFSEEIQVEIIVLHWTKMGCRLEKESTGRC